MSAVGATEKRTSALLPLRLRDLSAVRHAEKKPLTLRCAAAVAAFFCPRVAVGRVLEITTVFQSCWDMMKEGSEGGRREKAHSSGERGGTTGERGGTTGWAHVTLERLGRIGRCWWISSWDLDARRLSWTVSVKSRCCRPKLNLFACPFRHRFDCSMMPWEILRRLVNITRVIRHRKWDKLGARARLALEYSSRTAASPSRPATPQDAEQQRNERGESNSTLNRPF